MRFNKMCGRIDNVNMPSNKLLYISRQYARRLNQTIELNVNTLWRMTYA